MLSQDCSSSQKRSSPTHGPVRILLGQLKSGGDCLYATALARQIKVDYPGCHLTWAIGSRYRSILDGNPHVDGIWEVPLTGIDGDVEAWQQFERHAYERKSQGDFSEIFLTQIAPGNLENYDGSIRSSIFRGYPRPITVPISPVLRLSAREVENVRQFAEAHRLLDRKHVVLFECSPKSDQSFVTHDFAVEVARKLVAALPDACVILSSDIAISLTDERIIDGSVLSFRENAELTKFCSLLVGCSSGISWICTSDWAKALPMLQLLRPDAMWFNSLICDYTYWGIPVDSIIEMTPCQASRVVNCITTIINTGFAAARLCFHQDIRYKYLGYRAILNLFIRNGDYSKAAKLLFVNADRNKLDPHIFIWTIIILTRNIPILASHVFRSFYRYIICPLIPK